MTKNFVFIALFIAAFALTAAAQTGKTTTKATTVTAATATVQTKDPNEKAVRAQFDKLVKGINDSDVEAVTSVYNNSANTLYFNNNGSVTRGWQQDKDNREARYPKITNARLVPTNVRVELLGTGGAVLSCQWTLTEDFDGKPETASGRMTLVFKKIGTAWKIVHLHTSPDVVPANRPLLDSERKATEK